MTVQEFNLQMAKWALKVRRSAKQTLGTQTHGSGLLGLKLSQFVDKLSTQDPAYKIKFQFDRYGVFRAYGAGRGYVIVNGQIVRGTRIRTEREIRLRKWNDAASRFVQKGFTIAQVNRMKSYSLEDGRTIHRHPLDWIDVHINASINELADKVGEFYGDDAVKQLVDNFSKMRIVK